MSERPATRPRRGAGRAARRRRRLLPLAGGLALVVAVALSRSAGSHGGGNDPAASQAVPPPVLAVRPSTPLPAPISGESVVAAARRPADPRRARLQRRLGKRRLPTRARQRTAARGGRAERAAARRGGGRARRPGSGLRRRGRSEQRRGAGLPGDRRGRRRPDGGRSRSGAADRPLGPERGRRSAAAPTCSAATTAKRPLDSVLATSDGSASKRSRRSRPRPLHGGRGARRADLRLRRRGCERRAERRDPRGRPATAGPSARRHLPVALSHAAAVALGGRVYVLGGEGTAAADGRVWRFDPGSGKVVAGRPAAASRSPTAPPTTVGASGYLIGGDGAGGEALRRSSLLPAPHRAPAPATDRTRPGRRRADEPQRRRPALRRPPADRRPRQRPAARRQRPQAGSLALPLAGPPGARRAASTSPTTPSSPTAATGIISNEEQNERIVQPRLPQRASCSGPTGTPGSPAPNRATCTSPTTPTSGATAPSPSPTPRTAACCSSPRAKKVLQEIRRTRSRCEHEPPTALGSPNGDTPLRNGEHAGLRGERLLHRRDRPLTARSVWSVQLPIAYPSDPQQLGPNRYLVADYAEARRHLRVQPRRQDPLVLPPVLRAGDARPPEPRRAAAGRPDRRQRRLPRTAS